MFDSWPVCPKCGGEGYIPHHEDGEQSCPSCVVAWLREQGAIDYEAAASRVAKIHRSWATQLESCRESNPCYECQTKSRRAVDAALVIPLDGEPPKKEDGE